MPLGPHQRWLAPLPFRRPPRSSRVPGPPLLRSYGQLRAELGLGPAPAAVKIEAEHILGIKAKVFQVKQMGLQREAMAARRRKDDAELRRRQAADRAADAAFDEGAACSDTARMELDDIVRAARPH